MIYYGEFSKFTDKTSLTVEPTGQSWKIPFFWPKIILKISKYDQFEHTHR